MPLLPNAPGTHYAFEIVYKTQTDELIAQREQDGWIIQSWEPVNQSDELRCMIALAFTRSHSEEAKIIDVTPLQISLEKALAAAERAKMSYETSDDPNSRENAIRAGAEAFAYGRALTLLRKSLGE